MHVDKIDSVAQEAECRQTLEILEKVILNVPIRETERNYLQYPREMIDAIRHVYGDKKVSFPKELRACDDIHDINRLLILQVHPDIRTNDMFLDELAMYSDMLKQVENGGKINESAQYERLKLSLEKLKSIAFY